MPGLLDVNVNPYQSPRFELGRTATQTRWRFRIANTVATVSGILAAGYGLLGSLLNGLDLVGTLSRIDLYKELWLLSILVYGCAVYTAVYRLHKRHRTMAMSSLALVASTMFATLALIEFG